MGRIILGRFFAFFHSTFVSRVYSFGMYPYFGFLSTAFSLRTWLRSCLAAWLQAYLLTMSALTYTPYIHIYIHLHKQKICIICSIFSCTYILCRRTLHLVQALKVGCNVRNVESLQRPVTSMQATFCTLSTCHSRQTNRKIPRAGGVFTRCWLRWCSDLWRFVE